MRHRGNFDSSFADLNRHVDVFVYDDDNDGKRSGPRGSQCGKYRRFPRPLVWAV